MMIELAEGKKKRNKIYVQGYDRKANYVPGYSRRKAHLNDSSLFSFRLNDCNCPTIGGGAIVNHHVHGGAVVNDSVLVVPDPWCEFAPRAVRVDMFDNLPEEEFCKVIDYVQDYNSPEDLDEAILHYMEANAGLGDPPGESAIEVIGAVFDAPVNGTTVTTTSFWDDTTFGIPNKVAVPGGALLLYYLFKSKF